jgi:diguanylate cyclase (GGDEF)-like protein
VIGVLSAHRSTLHAFSEADLDLLTVVARYLAGAVKVARLYEQLKLLAATDVLTGLANRRGFFDRLTAEIARAQRTGEPFSIALVDVNFLKVINDRYGHGVGDRALIAMGQTLTRSIRASDLAARVGGDEFTLLLPGATFLQAENLLDRIAQTNVHAIDCTDGRAAPQFAWGIATWPADGQTADAPMQTADLRLYAMKVLPGKERDVSPRERF